MKKKQTYMNIVRIFHIRLIIQHKSHICYAIRSWKKHLNVSKTFWKDNIKLSKHQLIHVLC